MTQLTYELICRYPESAILYDGKPYAVAMISGITGMVVLETIDEGRTGWVDIAKCQLMLRTWEDMTDDEAIRVARMNKYNHGSNDAAFIRVGKTILQTVLVEKSDKMRIPMECCDYLRSISISTEPAETEGTYRVRANTIN